MKQILLIVITLLNCGVTFCQQQDKNNFNDTDYRKVFDCVQRGVRKINFNDPNYIRVIDGVTTNDKDIEPNKFPEIAYVSDEETKTKLGFGSSKDIMIINSPDYDIEDVIFEKVRDEYLKSAYPYYIKFPIIINGVLLTEVNRDKILTSLKERGLHNVRLLPRNAVKDQ